MHTDRWPVGAVVRSLVLAGLFIAGLGAQAQAPAAGTQATTATASSDSTLRETREQLISLLRMSPTLAEVVASDPSLLSNQEYVTRNNPELARFLEAHPEVTRNPDFYLFADISGGRGRRWRRSLRWRSVLLRLWDCSFRRC